MDIRKYITTPVKFEWGLKDCALWAADYVQAETGHDPAADVRGMYRDWAGYRRTAMRLGGVEAIVRKGMRPFEEVTDVRKGTFAGVIRLDGRVTCALFVDGRAAVLGKGGAVLREDFELLGAWQWSRR